MNKEVKTPRKKKEVELYVVRSGPRKGRPHCEAAFATKEEAVDFLTRLHGLSIDEARQVARSRALDLDPKWHGAEQCAIEVEAMGPTRARQALSGELYLPKVKDSDLPTPRAISMKITLKVKLKERKPPRSKRPRRTTGTKPTKK